MALADTPAAMALTGRAWLIHCYCLSRLSNNPPLPSSFANFLTLLRDMTSLVEPEFFADRRKIGLVVVRGKRINAKTVTLRPLTLSRTTEV